QKGHGSQSYQSRIVEHLESLSVRLSFGRFQSVAADVKAAFFGIRIFPPPAASAEILARLHRPRARGAADARITLVMEPIVRNLVLANIVPHLVVAPIDQRVNFDNGAVIS